MSRMDAERAQARAMREQGLPVAQIAQRLGLSRGSVSALLRPPARFATRTCLLCGTEFTPTNGRQRYCTRAHWREHNPCPPLRACRLCGRSFAPTSGNHRFCAPAHQREHQRRKREARAVAELRERERQLDAELARLRAREAA